MATAGKSRVPFTVTLCVVEHAGMGLHLAGQADGDPVPSKSSQLKSLFWLFLSSKKLTVVQLVKFPARSRTLGSITIFT
jgi:hypothetical protein